MKRTNDPEGLRQRVLDVAADAFQARGYQATSMHEVMREAGVTGGALYHHFPTKKALGLAVIRERVAREVAETWIAPVRAAPTAAQGIALTFRSIVAGLEERGRVAGCPLGNLALELSLADPEFRTAVEEVFESWRAAIAERLGAEGARHPHATATLVVASYSGAMTMAKAAQNPAPLTECAQLLAELMANP